jgi:hypothetical protein
MRDQIILMIINIANVIQVLLSFRLDCWREIIKNKHKKLEEEIKE